jgi:hypothetical protein
MKTAGSRRYRREGLLGTISAMNESESYWLSLVDELAEASDIVWPLTPGAMECPAWVDKITIELLNMATPKMQIRVGMKATPDKIGVMIGSHLVQLAQAKARPQLIPPTPEARAAMALGARLMTPPEMNHPVDVAMSRIPEMEAETRSLVARVLEERSPIEAGEFMRGLSRGLRQNAKSVTPEIVDGQPKFSPKQFEKLKTIMIYMLARNNWRELDKLETSRQAFEWFEKRLPAAVLGNDPERIRKMFSRAGKTFKPPGRPKKA